MILCDAAATWRCVVLTCWAEAKPENFVLPHAVTWRRVSDPVKGIPFLTCERSSVPLKVRPDNAKLSQRIHIEHYWTPLAIALYWIHTIHVKSRKLLIHLRTQQCHKICTSVQPPAIPWNRAVTSKSLRGNQRRHAPLPLWRALQVWTRRRAWSSTRRSKDGTSAACSLLNKEHEQCSNLSTSSGGDTSRLVLSQCYLHVMLQYLCLQVFIYMTFHFFLSPMPAWCDYFTEFSFAGKNPSTWCFNRFIVCCLYISGPFCDLISRQELPCTLYKDQPIIQSQLCSFLLAHLFNSPDLSDARPYTLAIFIRRFLCLCQERGVRLHILLRILDENISRITKAEFSTLEIRFEYGWYAWVPHAAFQSLLSFKDAKNLTTSCDAASSTHVRFRANLGLIGHIWYFVLSMA